MPPKNASAYQGARHYEWKGRKLPSVTTILQSYPKPWLGAWAAKMVAESAVNDKGWIGEYPDPLEAIAFLKGSPWRKRDVAADFGTAVHEALAALVRSEPIPAYPGADGHIGAVLEWWHAYRPHVTDSEVQVFAPEAGYAGSLDLICDVYGRRLICDLKTGSIGAEVRLQLAAYRYAEFIGEDDKRIAPVPEVDGCAILHIPRDNPAEWKFIEVAAGAAEYAIFQRLIGISEFVKANDRQDVGTLILPQVEVA